MCVYTFTLSSLYVCVYIHLLIIQDITVIVKGAHARQTFLELAVCMRVYTLLIV